MACRVYADTPPVAPNASAEVRQQAVEEDEKLPWYILRPDAVWHMTWDMMILVLVCYFSILVPVRIGFELVESASRGGCGRCIIMLGRVSQRRGLRAHLASPPPVSPMHRRLQVPATSRLTTSRTASSSSTAR